MAMVAFRWGLAGLLLGAFLSFSHAQDDDFRRLFRKPETALEYWNSLNFELDVGRPDLAAKYLRGLVDKKFPDKDLLTIVDKVGLTPVLRLRSVPKWSDDAKLDKQARADAAELVAGITAANRKRLTDPARMAELMAKLTASPEEKAYAEVELYKAGAQAVPFLVDAYIRTEDPGERLAYRKALDRLGPAALGPLLAALDSDATLLKLDILDVLRRRHVRNAAQIIPHLWYVAGSPKQPAEVRKKARALLAYFLEMDESRLPLAKVALTAEAEKYLHKKIAFGDPAAVPIWHWNGKRVVQGFGKSATVPAAQAEEYYGLRFAQLALTLDPTYRPAQLAFLTLAVERAMDRAGPVAPLARTSPQVAELLARASPELLLETLQNALREKRTGVALATVRALGARAEARGRQPVTGREPPLVQALYYPDQRVQLAAALALVRIPGLPGPRTAARVIDVLARALKPAAAYHPGKKILVAIAEDDYRERVAGAVAGTGADAVTVGTGREAMRWLRADPEIEAVLLDSTLPIPGLDFTLAQLRADVDVARLPVLLAAVPESRASREAARRAVKLREQLDRMNAETLGYRRALAALAEDESRERQEVDRDFGKDKSPAVVESRLAALQAIVDKYEGRRKEVQQDYSVSVRLLRDQPRVQKELDEELRRYDLESQVREAALERYVSRMPRVRVVHVSALTDPKSLESALQRMSKDAGPAVTAAEQADYAEQAVKALAGLAEGKPAGYDVTPVAGTLLDALRAGRLRPDGQLAAIRAAVTLTGERPQRVLATVILDGKRTADVRLAALRGLIVNVQRQGNKLLSDDVRTLEALSRQAGVDPKLKDALPNLIGALRPSERATGERLRDFPLAPPAAPLPPPK